MNSKLREDIETVELKYAETNNALQSVSRRIIFSGFGNDEPRMSICSELGKVTLEYHGMLMDEEHIIHYIESQGYITPNDFRQYGTRAH